jgi:beta-lysine 5,6-aminomutase alpha subunit
MLTYNVDKGLVDECHRLSSAVVDQVQGELAGSTTVSTERAVARLFGVDGADREEVPLANMLIDHLKSLDKLGDGVAIHLVNACSALGLTPAEVAQRVSTGKLNLSSVPWQGRESNLAKAMEFAADAVKRIDERKRERESLLESYPVLETPWLYVIVATGNIYEDVKQARMAASQGADVIAVIRSTGQSLLDYVPYGATTEGYGGTYATQENFRIMRGALDEESKRLGRYIRLVNYCSGLCMPEIAAMGAVERLDMMLNDAMYGILFRDINAQRTLIDQRFSRMLNAYAGVIINTGEDNYLTTADAFNSGQSVLASQFINYHFAKSAGLPEEQMGLGHAFQIDPSIEDSLSYEIASALLVRSLFPKCPVKFMPPTVHKSGDIFFAHTLDASFNAVSVLTGQSIHLVGMLTEAIHTPLLQDRYASIRAAKYARTGMKHLGDSLVLKEGSLIDTRAQELLAKCCSLLREIRRKGLFQAIEEGVFAGVRRNRSGGKGGEGVVRKTEWYMNPIEELLKKELSGTAETEVSNS